MIGVPGLLDARIHSLPEALVRLASPSAQEELATLTGEGILWVYLPAEDPEPLSQSALAKTLALLDWLGLSHFGTCSRSSEPFHRGSRCWV